MRGVRIFKLAAGFGVAASALGLFGCAKQAPPAPALEVGTSAAGLFALPEVSDEALAGGFEGSRRDAALSVGQPGPVLATNEWPEPERATLERARWILVGDSFLDSRYSVFYLPPRR